MTVFLESTIATLKAHRAEIENLIKVITIRAQYSEHPNPQLPPLLCAKA